MINITKKDRINRKVRAIGRGCPCFPSAKSTSVICHSTLSFEDRTAILIFVVNGLRWSGNDAKSFQIPGEKISAMNKNKNRNN